MENKKICLIGLADKENAFFERIVKLSANRQTNQFELVHTQNEADLLVVQGDTDSLALIEPIQSAKVLLIAGDIKANKNCPEIVLPRPFLMSRVFKLLDQAVHLIPQDFTLENKNITVEEKQPSKVTIVEDNKKVEPSAKIKQSPDEKATTKIKALVIDDSLPLRMQLQIALDDANISSDLAESGEKGLEFAEASDYDLVFLDIMMPGIDGYEVCERMRKMEKMKKTPIIMLSGKTSPLDEVKGVIAGATTYMTKPVTTEELDKVLVRMKKWIDTFRRN